MNPELLAQAMWEDASTLFAQYKFLKTVRKWPELTDAERETCVLRAKKAMVRVKEIESGQNTGQSAPVTCKERMDAAIKTATAIVVSWPAWKQNILEQSGKSTVSEPRKPILEDEY